MQIIIKQEWIEVLKDFWWEVVFPTWAIIFLAIVTLSGIIAIIALIAYFLS